MCRPNYRWGNQEPLWPISPKALSAVPTSRVEELSQPKIDYSIPRTIMYVVNGLVEIFICTLPKTVGLMNTLSHSQGMLFLDCADHSLSMDVDDLLKSGPLPHKLSAVLNPAKGCVN